jgi:hypothetical protein
MSEMRASFSAQSMSWELLCAAHNETSPGTLDATQHALRFIYHPVFAFHIAYSDIHAPLYSSL